MNRLLGKDTRHVSRDRMIFHSRLLYQVRMGYVDLDNPKAHQSIAYKVEEHLFDHDLSVRSIGRSYAMRKLKDQIPLELFLHLPIDHSEMLIEGMLLGDEERAQMEKDAADRAAQEEQVRKDKAAQGFNDIHEQNNQ